MPNESKMLVSAISGAALTRAAQIVVSNAIAGAFNEDPVIGPDLSRAMSTLNSVVKRHGLLLQKTLADALVDSDRFDVMVDVAMPVTDAANELLLARNSAEDLARINIRSDAAAAKMVTVDLVVVDPETGWAGAYDVKRGNGTTESRKRKPIEFELRATRLILASYLAKRGYPNITSVTTGVIDYYGSTGFSRELKINREELDSHFGVPVRHAMDTITIALRDALHAELPNLFGNALKAIRRDVAKESGSPVIPFPQDDNDATGGLLANVLNARPKGPGPRGSGSGSQTSGAA